MYILKNVLLVLAVVCTHAPGKVTWISDSGESYAGSNTLQSASESKFTAPDYDEVANHSSVAVESHAGSNTLQSANESKFTAPDYDEVANHSSVAVESNAESNPLPISEIKNENTKSFTENVDASALDNLKTVLEKVDKKFTITIFLPEGLSISNELKNLFKPYCKASNSTIDYYCGMGVVCSLWATFTFIIAYFVTIECNLDVVDPMTRILNNQTLKSICGV